MNLKPALPAPSSISTWDGFDVLRTFRGKALTIRIANPAHVSTGIASVTVDGAPVELVADGKRGALVPVEALADGAVLDVVMG